LAQNNPTWVCWLSVTLPKALLQSVIGGPCGCLVIVARAV
jgi:hypothetical protein